MAQEYSFSNTYNLNVYLNASSAAQDIVRRIQEVHQPRALQPAVAEQLVFAITGAIGHLFHGQLGSATRSTTVRVSDAEVTLTLNNCPTSHTEPVWTRA